jgi:hypothetical protein
MRRLIICGMFLIGLSATGPAEDNIDQNGVDLLQAALDSIGYTYSDLGYRPKGYWNRFPTGIPYKLKSFDDLYAEPLGLYNYARSFGGAVRRYCDPARLDSADNSLYNLVYHLGVERKTGGFRSYGANLVDAPGGERPFIRAVENLYITTGDKMQYVTFNQKADWPDLKKELSEKTASLPYPVRLALAGLVENLREAIYWQSLGVRNIPSEIMNRVFYIRDLAETQGDGMKYYPEIDDAAQTIDFESVCYAALKVAAAAEHAEKKLTPLLKDVPRDFALDFPTPYGRAVINGRGDNLVNGDYCLFIIDFGGDDTYTGPAGATSRPGHGVSVLIDLEGNDIYKSENMTPSFGAGILGVGLLYDATGSDRYEGKLFSQGAGFLGLGMLFDKSGSDDYKSETSSQGAGYFGIGLAIDCAGDDSYYLYGDGQGMGGVGGGVGCLADYSGDDKYMAEPSPKIVNRADYHSQFKINANNAQGGGFGRRGDGSDGHSWAGGLGAIVDIYGNDLYESGNWSLGCGYWFGTGICYDEAGDDVYRSVYFTQASGAHFCNGALIDECGDDKHILYETAGAALAFGWDFTNALFVDRDGNDQYEARMISYGLAQIRSFAFFFEMGGADSYTYGKGRQGFGAASFRDIYAKPSELRTYDYYTKSAGIFIDASGTDNYLIKEDAETAASEKMKDNTVWFTPEKSDSNYGHNNFGIGIDADGGKIPELEIFD